MRRSLSRIAAVGAVVLLGLLAVGCGGSDGDDAARGDDPTRTTRTTQGSSAAGACALLTESDVETAFGEPVVAGRQTSDECWWSTANDLKTVNLVRRTDDLATWRQGYANDFWVPNDLGDEGYSGTVLDSIVWRVGDTQYEVNVVYSTKGDPEQVVQDLAAKAAARL